MTTNFINQIIRVLVWITKFFGCKKCIKKPAIQLRTPAFGIYVDYERERYNGERVMIICCVCVSKWLLMTFSSYEI
jgi:hypothetical protein